MPPLNTRGANGGLTGALLADIVLQVMCHLAQVNGTGRSSASARA